ncbi:hypothetical protein [Flavimarina sp. Hel_I_48]|uniref:hypothetical protein n=1 Tax=Flavimarina sp. Hel_I_48 TaxID=1392488 RepID=UPI0004DFC74C|nr:hypothetical protein [Flavimarina sp. Hel_I_48]
MLTELNENKLIQIRIHLKNIIKEGSQLIEENSSHFNIYQSLFRRYIYAFESLIILTKDFDHTKTHRAQSIAVILRANLLDTLIIIYLKTFQFEKERGADIEKVKYQNEIDKLYSEQIRRFITISEPDKKIPTYNHKKFCEMVDKIRKTFDYLFNDEIDIDYNKPSKSMKFKSSDDITNKIIRKRLDNYSAQLKDYNYLQIFSLYDIYSKYDHFGVASMTLEYNTTNEICDHMFWSIFHITDGITFCIDLLNSEVSSESDFKNIHYELSCLRGVVYTEHLYLSPKYKEDNK